jgi:hypothetical protein
MSDKHKKAASAAKLHKDSMPCNKPKKTPGHPTKSHVVKACENGKEKIIRFGQQGVSGSPKKEGESEAYRKRRESFKARHSKNIAKGKMSAAFWADRVKWLMLGSVLGSEIINQCIQHIHTVLT